MKTGDRFEIPVTGSMGSVRYVGPARLGGGAIDAWVGLEMDFDASRWTPAWQDSGLHIVTVRVALWGRAHPD